jgi:hypothetical protein
MDHNENHTLLLGRVEGKLDAVIARFDRQDRRIDEVEDRIGEVEGRVGVLENWRWYLAGIAAAAAFIVPYLNITSLFTH